MASTKGETIVIPAAIATITNSSMLVLRFRVRDFCDSILSQLEFTVNHCYKLLHLGIVPQLPAYYYVKPVNLFENACFLAVVV